MTHHPSRLDQGLAQSRHDVPVALLLLAAMAAQLVSPAFAPPAAAQAADSVARPLAGAETATTARAREDRHWADLVRACAANAQHVRLHVRSGVIETAGIVPEAAGLRFRSPRLAPRMGAITEEYVGADTLVAWNDVLQVDVRNVNSAGETAGTGLAIGLGAGTVVALLAATAATATSIYSFRQQDSHAAGIILGGAALGLLVGALAPRHPNGGWITCCTRDTSEVISADVTLH